MGKYLKLALFLSLSLIMRGKAFSTHLKAGEITSQRISGYQYKFILTIYTDSNSVVNFGVDEPNATLDFGDGNTQTVNRDAPGRISIGNATFKNVYTFIHTFSGNGKYTVSYQRDNRNANILNINGGNSGNTPFYIESSITVNPFLGVNNSPILQYPPIDEGDVGEVFKHNPAAYDPEGDSISYDLGTPLEFKNTPVSNYSLPNLYGGTFNLNPITGDLTWDSPIKAGLYNIVIIIKEWRNGQIIGTIERDMQVLINPHDNRKPVLQIPNDTCVIAGTNFKNVIIKATDPDNDKINLTAISGIFTSVTPKATFNVTNPNPNPAIGIFNWNTTCDLVRDQPYDILFRAEDIHPTGTQLVDLKTWQIKIVAPAPQGLTVSPAAKGLKITWTPYVCTKASKMQIYRKDCDSSKFVVDTCEGGVPPGFKKIADVPISATSYNDTTNVSPGSFYCYVIVATFPVPKGGVSLPSDQTCMVMNLGEPLPTNVTVEKTDSLKGKIKVVWTQPFELDQSLYPGPYQYIVTRALGLTGNSFVPLATFTNLTDTTFIDSLLDTKDAGYNYRVNFYYTKNGNLTQKSSSVAFSSVYLTAIPGGNKATLTWTYQDPWKNEGHYHRIYKETSPDVFTLIDSIFVTGNKGTYTATGLTNGDTTCFYVETEGEYCRSGLPKPLLNKSEIVCIVPHDTLPPCPPYLMGPNACIDDGITQLTVFWKPNKGPGCNKEIKGYNVYYAEHEEDDLTLFAANVPDTFFVDIDNFSLAGCYAVTALNYYGQESAKSNKVCVDLCVYYELPNLITPNRDSHNDVFKPFPIPKNVKQVNFTVFNRWGNRVYFSNNDINLNWPGTDENGQLVASGVYYYEAEVLFKRRLRKKDELKIIKGWVHVVHNDLPPPKEQ
jgi:gliding motility-associated-like protein